MNLKQLSAVSVLAFASLFAINASATPITGLFNTGSGSANGALDLNYQLTKLAGDTDAIINANGYGYDSGGTTGFPFPPWMPNTVDSQWLTPHRNAADTFDPNDTAGDDSGLYRWRFTFNIAAAGFDAATAFLTGRWATDNTGVLTLNGNTILNASVGTDLPNQIRGFEQWTSFSSGSGNLQVGLNTLDFLVTNTERTGGNPTGLRVEFLSSDIPEPGMLALLALGLVGLGIARRRT